MTIKNFFALFVLTLLSSKLNSQINYSDLRNANGGIYDYALGPAYYKDSLYTGGVIQYVSDSVLYRKTSYINGEPSGYEICYYETGKIWCIGLREHRWQQGEWVFYCRNGELQSIQVFKDGILISEGQPITEWPKAY